ncbi:MAG TPA: histidine phosphatase family protein [Thermomicrobiales bacterium]|nr:histidine phosphatase family protein [Thermomicrobiales bacterium]
MPEPRLILVKHSLPEIVPSVPAAEWRLGPAGRARCGPLAERLRAYRPAAVVGSVEPKAAETAALVASALGVPRETAAGLHEHDRRDVGFLDDAAFEASVAAFFAAPDALVFGRETARQAERRFARAVAGVLARRPDQTVVVVAHGTVVSLFVAAHTGLDARDLWRRLGLPSYIVLARPTLSLLAVVEEVGV